MKKVESSFNTKQGIECMCFFFLHMPDELYSLWMSWLQSMNILISKFSYLQRVQIFSTAEENSCHYMTCS